MSSLNIRGTELPRAWGQSGAQAVSLRAGVYPYELFWPWKQAARRLEQDDVVSVIKSLAYDPITGNTLLKPNGETPLRLKPTSMALDFWTMTTLNCWGHSGIGLLNTLRKHVWDGVRATKYWVLSLVSDKPKLMDKKDEFEQMCDRLEEFDYSFQSWPIIEIVAACPNVEISMGNILKDNPHVIRVVRERFPEAIIGANISPVAPTDAFKAAQDAGADYVAICNTYPHGHPDLPENIPWRSKSPLVRYGFKPGGYSGPFCAPLIIKKVETVAPELTVPVGFGNGFYTTELIRQGYAAGGAFARVGGMVKLYRPWRIPGLVHTANTYR